MYKHSSWEALAAVLSAERNHKRKADNGEGDSSSFTTQLQIDAARRQGGALHQHAGTCAALALTSAVITWQATMDWRRYRKLKSLELMEQWLLRQRRLFFLRPSVLRTAVLSFGAVHYRFGGSGEHPFRCTKARESSAADTSQVWREKDIVLAYAHILFRPIAHLCCCRRTITKDISNTFGAIPYTDLSVFILRLKPKRKANNASDCRSRFAIALRIHHISQGMGDHVSDYGVFNESVWDGRRHYGLLSLARRATAIPDQGGISFFLSIFGRRSSLARNLVVAQCQYRTSCHTLELARSRASRDWRIRPVAAWTRYLS
eukprot:scaffold2363_cov159-Amphora_coffeaeformis.AAC.29